LVIARHAAAIVQHVTAIVNQARGLAPLASLTIVAHATMHHVHRVTLTHLKPHAVTMTTFSPAPTRIWAPKAA
jgi:hypothetical protein